MTLLLIDDSRSVHAYIKECLKANQDYKYIDLMDGIETQNLTADQMASIDLVLLDWEMPKQDGPTTLSWLKQKLNCPIVMLTSRNNPEDMLKAIELGAAEYVMKPFTADILIEKIKMVVAQKAA